MSLKNTPLKWARSSWVSPGCSDEQIARHLLVTVSELPGRQHAYAHSGSNNYFTASL